MPAALSRAHAHSQHSARTDAGRTHARAHALHPPRTRACARVTSRTHARRPSHRKPSEPRSERAPGRASQGEPAPRAERLGPCHRRRGEPARRQPAPAIRGGIGHRAWASLTLGRCQLARGGAPVCLKQAQSGSEPERCGQPVCAASRGVFVAGCSGSHPGQPEPQTLRWLRVSAAVGSRNPAA